MAYITLTNCPECGKEFQGTPHRLCGECSTKREKRRKAKWDIERRKDRSLEERIEFIEDWIYKHNKVNHTNHNQLYG